MDREKRAAELALGRIFRMLSRPYRPGDVEEYERCRGIVLDMAGPAAVEAWVPNYARDRGKGAEGD